MEIHATESKTHTSVEINERRSMILRVRDELEGAEADRPPDRWCVDDHGGWGRCNHDSSTRRSHRRRQLTWGYHDKSQGRVPQVD